MPCLWALVLLSPVTSTFPPAVHVPNSKQQMRSRIGKPYEPALELIELILILGCWLSHRGIRSKTRRFPPNGTQRGLPRAAALVA